MAALADWLAKEQGARIVLLPQSLGSGGDDPAVSRAVRERSEHPEAVEVLEADLGLDELKDLYGSLELLVGTRMHANLIALTSGVPVVAVAYEVKTRGIMEQLGLEDYVVEISTIRADELIRVVGEAWSFREELRERVARGVDELRHRAVVWVDEVDGLLTTGATRR
jgi:colanic acid/amylovoran biosynthesis protein